MFNGEMPPFYRGNLRFFILYEEFSTYISDLLIFLRTELPAPIIPSSHILMPLTDTDWLPIKQFSQTLQSPLTIVPVEIWHWSPITALCPILYL